MAKAPARKSAAKTKPSVPDSVIAESSPPTRAPENATKEQFEAADFAARRAISGF